jgi:hypothetical protein
MPKNRDKPTVRECQSDRLLADIDAFFEMPGGIADSCDISLSPFGSG